MFNCSCCGDEVTSPYFYGGGVYGYTCIKKVNSKARKNKAKSRVVEVDVLRLYFNTDVPRLGQAAIQFKSGKMVKIEFLKKISHDGSYLKEIDDPNFSFQDGKYWIII